MTRKALLIGNSNGLSGVKIDLANWQNFLKSNTGGCWYDSEIEILMNPSKIELLQKVNELKRQRPDFAIVVFSGHGTYDRSTILEINAKEEQIYDTDLYNIGSRQISVFDCCRAVTSLNEGVELFAYGGRLLNSNQYNYVRKEYEKRIMQTPPQHIVLYSCSIGETSLDTEYGGLYTKNLLNSARDIGSNIYKLVSNIHEEAKDNTAYEASIKYEKQNPSAILPKHISNLQLILSISIMV